MEKLMNRIEQEIQDQNKLMDRIKKLVYEYNKSDRIQYLEFNKTGLGATLEYYFKGR